MLKQAVEENDEVALLIQRGLGDSSDPRIPEIVFMLVKKGIFSVEDVQELIDCVPVFARG